MDPRFDREPTTVRRRSGRDNGGRPLLPRTLRFAGAGRQQTRITVLLSGVVGKLSVKRPGLQAGPYRFFAFLQGVREAAGPEFELELSDPESIVPADFPPRDQTRFAEHHFDLPVRLL